MRESTSGKTYPSWQTINKRTKVAKRQGKAGASKGKASKDEHVRESRHDSASLETPKESYTEFGTVQPPSPTAILKTNTTAPQDDADFESQQHPVPGEDADSETQQPSAPQEFQLLVQKFVHDFSGDSVGEDLTPAELEEMIKTDVATLELLRRMTDAVRENLRKRSERLAAVRTPELLKTISDGEDNEDGWSDEESSSID